MGTVAQHAVLTPAKRRLPPGPRGLRFLLKLRHFPDGWLDFLVRCTQDYGDIVYFKILGVPACLINSPAGLEHVLVTGSQNFTKSMDYRACSARDSLPAKAICGRNNAVSFSPPSFATGSFPTAAS